MPSGSQPGEHVERWIVPVKGTLRGLPIYEVPQDAIWDGRNVLVRAGRLRPRPGFTRHSKTLFPTPVIGGINTTSLAGGAFQADAFQNDAFQIEANDPATNIVVSTLDGIWVLRGGIWIDITDTPLTADLNNQARFSAMEVNSELWIVMTNGVDTPRKWDGSDPEVEVMTGWPVFADWTNVADHLIGIVPPYQVRWGQGLDITTVPNALNVKSLAETTDRLRAIRSLGTLRAGIYKERSLWVVSFQGGSDPTAFHFELRGFFEGPASSSALVDLDGFHIYMTDTGKVALFDGFSHHWIVEGIKPIMDVTLDRAFGPRIFGVFDDINRVVHFYYPRIGDAGALKGIVTVILPRPEDGIPTPIAFVGELGWPVSAGLSLREADHSILAFRADAGETRSYVMTDTDDAGVPIQGFWQTGLRTTPGQDPYRIMAIETFALRGPSFGAVTLRPVYSYLLDDEGGTIETLHPVEVDLETIRPKDPRGTDVRGNFFGLRYDFETPVTLFWQGARLVAARRE